MVVAIYGDFIVTHALPPPASHALTHSDSQAGS